MERQFQEIQALVLQGESERLEFKKSTGQLSRAGETICAFLNNHGGIVLIGVDDQGNIVGQMISDSTQQEIAHLVIGHLSPHPEIHIQYVDIPDSTLKVILLEASEHANEKPYTFHHKPYYRVQSTNKIMEQPQYHQLLLNRQRQPVHWDALINTRCTLEQLDQDRIYEVVNFGIRNKRLPAQLATRDVGEILDKLGLRENGQLNNAAVVLFCKDMLPIFVQCILKMAALRGNSKRDFIDLQQIHGNFFDLLEKAEEFVGRHTSIAAHFVQNSFQRVDVPDYPPLAVREALINALCHRDYSHPGGSIAMSLFSDRLEINNMGRLSPELSFELLRTEHTSVPRNAKIADVLFRCAYIEKIGTGTQEIIQLCDEAHMPPPEFGEQGGFFVMTMRKALPIVQADTPTPNDLALTMRQQHILTVLQVQGTLSNQKILAQLTPMITDRTLRHDLSQLHSLGYVERTGQGRSTAWQLKKTMGIDPEIDPVKSGN